MLVPGFNLERYDSGVILAPTGATLERPCLSKWGMRNPEDSGMAGASVSPLTFCIKARTCSL